MSEKMPELKPCPFCGGKTKIFQGSDDRLRGFVCDRKPCAGSGMYFTFLVDKQDDAIKAWNTRSDLIPAIRR